MMKDIEQRLSDVEGAVARVQQEQTYLRNELTTGINGIAQQISNLAGKMDAFNYSLGQASNTPAGREVLARIEAIERDEASHQATLRKLEDWYTTAQGQLRLFKWAAGGGAMSAIALLLKLLGVPLPL